MTLPLTTRGLADLVAAAREPVRRTAAEAAYGATIVQRAIHEGALLVSYAEDTCYLTANAARLARRD